MEFAVEQLLPMSFVIDPFASGGVVLVGYVCSSTIQESKDEDGGVVKGCPAELLLSLSIDTARIDEEPSGDGEGGDATADVFPSLDT